jgi:hypothetical protein
MALASLGFILPGFTGGQIRKGIHYFKNTDEILAGLKKAGLELTKKPHETLGSMV